MHRCKICLAPVLLRKKRKRLDVLSSSFVRQGIVELACKIGQNSDEAKLEFSEGYVCMSCFRAVGNYAVLKEIEGQLLNKLSASTQSRPIPKAMVQISTRKGDQFGARE